MDKIFELEWRKGRTTQRTELQARTPVDALKLLDFYIDGWDEMRLVSVRDRVADKPLDFWANWN